MDDTNESLGISPTGTPYRVLLVDDSIFVKKQLKQILLSENFQIIGEAADGNEAVDFYQNNKNEIDLVTMDITMPNKDGITALKEIIAFDPSAIVVMVSALGKEELVKESLLTGAKSYIVKPLDRTKVLDRLKKIFNH